MNNSFISKRLIITGIVQGVGFRPFVYRLAKAYRLVGEVSNTSFGVDIVIEGEKNNVDGFIGDFPRKIPQLACINEIVINEQLPANFKVFSIIESKDLAGKTTFISPDVSICSDCLSELMNSNDRRYHYPFINCTNCGPRYTIIGKIPYDRFSTVMKCFVMCAKCQHEYNNPENRRFHAQPNACSVCGPNVILSDSSGNSLNLENPINAISNFIKSGCIVAVKGLGGYHLVVDATCEDSVARLRKLKCRSEKPFALMSLNIEDIRKYAYVRLEDEALLTSFRKPIVLLKKRNINVISKLVSTNCYYGVMLPYTPIHYLLLNEGFTALVLTSANLNKSPIISDNFDVFDKLSGVVDFFLVHNRDILIKSDDSVVRYYGGASRVIRRSRGYAPSPINLNSRVPQILACGADLKNTVCLTKDNKAFLSQHIGDLNNMATYNFFCETISHMEYIFRINPEIVACDYHPDYMSTKYAFNRDRVRIVKVQHHHAHIAACMAENKIGNVPVIGLALDGTGFGNDGTIWGGEVLIADYSSFKRIAYLDPVSMPGGYKAILEPWRMAVSYLYYVFGESIINMDLPMLKYVDKDKIKLLVVMIQQGVNSPYTSSVGRFFDGVSAIIGTHKYKEITFEGQAAIELEMAANTSNEEFYDFAVQEGIEMKLLISPIIFGVVNDMKKGFLISDISAKFHNTLAIMFSKVCFNLRKRYGINQVVLSGGVFQNRLLLNTILMNLDRMAFEVFSHKLVPFNDGGISLGQAMVAGYAN